ncbi:Bromodomain adjacent to zinc finger domain protein 1A [Larimichthys crocea]|nr:Bromodomain adjacent to zinc finger domain protein 1A [Larimichthys crocea]
MPLLHRKAFIRQKPPADLRPDEEVFLCKITHEIFRTYDEFFERTILCNSLVWSCALTGRAGLTYLEAVESERRAKQSLQSFPPPLVVPLLHLATLSRRCRLTELCEDIYAFVKERFFPGETVDVNGRNGARHVCEVLQVHSPHSSANGAPAANGHVKPADADAIIISDSDDESRTFQSPTAQMNSPAPKGGGRGSPAQAGSSLLKAAEKLKLLQQKEEMAAAAQDKARLKKEKEEAQEAKRREREDRERQKEEQRRRFEEEKLKRREEKERRKLEKEREREKLKEEKKKYAERLKLWNKPREDMECEDLKELPSAVPVRTRLPAELFGEALMVLEFLRAFGEVFELKDEFPDGVSLEVLEEALVGSDPEGPLCELLFFFLSAIFQALDEEQEEVAKDQAEDLSEALDDDSDATQSALSAIASLAAAWPQLHQGCSLKQLDLDSCTLSEILRLHILASGADCYHGNAKFRYQKQGGFTLMDDPCVELRLAEPALLKRLSNTAVYDLMPEEKLREQEQRMKEKEERLKEGVRINSDTPAEQRAEEDDEQNSASNTKMKTKLNQKDKQQPMTSDPKPPSGPSTTLTAEELESEQEKVRELQERIQKAAACTCLLPLGRDRLYRRYWLLPSASTLFVEDDCFGLTEDMLHPQPKPAQDATTKMEDEEVVKEEPAEGSVGSSPAPINTCGPPVKRPNQWSFYSSVEEVDQLIEALNPRGHRESSLKEALLQERERLQHLLQNCDRSKYSHTDDPESSRSVPECTAAAETLMEVRLRDLLLDIEDRIHQGTLGTLKVVSSSVRVLAQALVHIEHGIERRFLKAPLGEEDSKKDQKTKKSKKKDEDQASDDGSDSGRISKTVLDRWRESLQSCSSLSQVFVHLSSLERSVLWSRSVLNARCRICRRKGDADNMLLCDGCDRGHHTHCLRPRLKSVPEGDWFCPDCRPKQRSSRVPSRQRSSIDKEEEEDEEQEDEEEEEEESEQEEEESDEEEESEEEEEEEVVVSTKKSPAPPPKGKNQQAVPKGQQASAGKNSSASKSVLKLSGRFILDEVPVHPDPRFMSSVQSQVLREKDHAPHSEGQHSIWR